MSLPSEQSKSMCNLDQTNRPRPVDTVSCSEKTSKNITLEIDSKNNENTCSNQSPITTKPKRKKKKISKKRCNMEGCRIKLGLCAVECKCGMKFCPKHFQSSSHNCTFDYQAEYRKRLDKSFGEKIEFAKIDKL